MVKRTLTILLFLLATGVAWVGLQQVRFDGDGGAILPAGLTEVQGIDLLRGAFAVREESVLILRGPGGEEVREVADGLAEFLEGHAGVVSHVVDPQRVREAMARHDGGGDDMLSRAAAMAAYRWLEESPEAFSDLERRLSAAELASFPDGMAAGISEDPLGLADLGSRLHDGARLRSDSGVLVNTAENGRFRVLYIRSAVDDLSSGQAVEWLGQLRELVGEWRAEHPELAGVRIQFAGEPSHLAETVGAMRRDLLISVGVTLLCIVGLFFFMHRRPGALIGMIVCLCYVVLLTLGVGTLLFGPLNIISIGFAAILLGLCVDYGTILYQESLGGARDRVQLRRAVGAGILWAALTTLVVFLRLHFSSIPGIAQLGVMVAIGVGMGAVVMFFIYPVMLTRIRRPRSVPVSPWRLMTLRSWRRLAVTPVLAIVLMAGLWHFGLPEVSRDFTILRPVDGRAAESYREMQRAFDLDGKARVGLVLRAGDSDGLWEVREQARQRLERAVEAGGVKGYSLPGRNLDGVRGLLEQRGEIMDTLRRRELLDEEALVWTSEVFDSWDALVHLPAEGFAPGGALRRAGLDRLFGREGSQVTLLGYVEAADSKAYDEYDFSWAEGVTGDNILLAGWEIMGPVLIDKALEDFQGVFIPLGAVLVLMLIVLFRDIRDVFLCLGVMLLGSLCLLAWMRWLGWEWNFINLFAVPLLFGVGVDFAIHMIFSLRRVGGDMPAIRRGIRKAMVFCALTTAAGFGSLSFASNDGLASLGRVCAVGIIIAMIFSVYFLPQWWLFLHRKR